MNRQNRSLVMMGVVSVILYANAAHAQYKQLSLIYDDMYAQAIGTAGDVTCSVLKDAAGSNIWTECDTSNPNNVSTNILLIKLAKGGGGSGRKNIFVMGNQHGDEFIGYRCAWDMAQFVGLQGTDLLLYCCIHGSDDVIFLS